MYTSEAQIRRVNWRCSNWSPDFQLSCPHACQVTLVVSDSLRPYGLPVSPIHGILQASYWSGLPCPPQGNLPELGIEPMSLMSSALACWFFSTTASWEDLKLCYFLWKQKASIFFPNCFWKIYKYRIWRNLLEISY